METFPCVVVCAYPSNKQMIITRMSGQYFVYVHRNKEKSDGVVKRRFDCPLCSSPVRESTARLEDALMVDQFEVSECTLPGPSVADIPEDGVVASCHPPLVFKPCGLYIVFPPRASLYPAVRLITWRRVSTSKHVG